MVTCQGFTALQVRCLQDSLPQLCLLSFGISPEGEGHQIVHSTPRKLTPPGCVQMQCSVCDEQGLFAYPWGKAEQGSQGDPSGPQPTLQCFDGTNMVDAASNPSANATLLNMTRATQGLVAYQNSITPSRRSEPPAACTQPCHPPRLAFPAVLGHTAVPDSAYSQPLQI